MQKEIDKRIIVIATIVAITAILYFPVHQFEFQDFDDDLYVTENQQVQKGLSIDSLRWAFSFKNKESTYWHPLTWLSHMLDVQLFGLK
nr:hypothetical protein [Desulfobacterales bacterium]